MTRTLIGTLALALSLGLANDAAAQGRRGERGDDDLRDRRQRMEELRRERDDRRWRDGRRERDDRRWRDGRRWRDDRRILDRRRDRAVRQRILADRHRRAHRADRYRARGGPAFCRSGAGHPVFGRRWCREKGFGLGRSLGRDHDRRGRAIRYRAYDRRRRDILRHRYRDRTLPVIILGRRPYDHRFRRHRPLGHTDLGHLLGAAAMEFVLHEVLDLPSYRSRHITGRWHDARFHDRRGTAWWQAGHATAAGVEPLALQLFLEGERMAELADLDRDGRVDLLLTGR